MQYWRDEVSKFCSTTGSYSGMKRNKFNRQQIFFTYDSRKKIRILKIFSAVKVSRRVPDNSGDVF
jgi:hypothetical protein